jgi:predicted O-methyltransferase YrrM
MYSPVVISFKYLGYYITSANGKGHGIHSPFVFEFVTKILRDTFVYPEYQQVNSLRKQLLVDKTPIPIEDYGAGAVQNSQTKIISLIARTSAKSKKYGELLFRMTRYYKPGYILELGTSLAISTSYLALGNKNAIVVSGEGNYAAAAKAENNLRCLSLGHVRIITGDFRNTLRPMVASLPYIDFSFIDGNHRRDSTLEYFHEIFQNSSASSVIIIDDIHWSNEMEDAWKVICRDPSVLLTIDLFFLGIVFKRPEFKVKQHFSIRF